MNAGAFGYNIWNNVLGVDIINKKGLLYHKNVKKFDFFYRKVKNLKKQEWFVGCYLKFNFNKKKVKNNKFLLKRKKYEIQ